MEPNSFIVSEPNSDLLAGEGGEAAVRCSWGGRGCEAAAAAAEEAEEAAEAAEAEAAAAARSTSSRVGGHQTVTVFDPARALAAGEEAQSPAARRS